MKKLITLIAITTMFTLTSCGTGTAPETEVSDLDSAACADTCKKDTVAVVVDTTTTSDAISVK